MPYSKAAKRTRFIKSYILAALVGYGGFVLGGYLNFYLVIGLSFFVVSLLLFETDSEHPPALGITMAFLLFRVPFSGILIVLLGVVILVVAKTLLQTIGIAVKSGTIHIR
jgi:hypothetical protein